MDEERLIRILRNRLRPVRRVASPWRSSTIWTIGTLMILALGISLSHVRPDLVDWAGQLRTWAELAIAAGTAASAACAACHAAIPGRDPRWTIPPVLGCIAWLAFLGIGCLAPIDQSEADIVCASNLSCLTFIVAFGTPVLMLTLFLARDALLLYPMRVAVLGGIAAAASADAAVGVVDHPHGAAATLVWHGGAALLLALVAAVCGPWWMRRAMALRRDA